MFNDPVGEGDRYRLRLWRNDSLLTRPQELTTYEDRFWDGRSFDNIDLPAPQISGTPFPAGTTFRIEKVLFPNDTSTIWNFYFSKQYRLEVHSTRPLPHYWATLNAYQTPIAFRWVTLTPAPSALPVWNLKNKIKRL